MVIVFFVNEVSISLTLTIFIRIYNLSIQEMKILEHFVVILHQALFDNSSEKRSIRKRILDNFKYGYG